MTVDADLFKRLTTAYDKIVTALDESKLGGGDAFSLLAQMLSQLSQDSEEDFLSRMECHYKLERILRPESKEIH